MNNFNTFLIIQYYKIPSPTCGQKSLLGEEIFSNIEEAFIPDLVKKDPKAFLVKKFNGKESYTWLVTSISKKQDGDITLYEILLDEYESSVPEISLHETVYKSALGPRKTSSLLYTGTLVDVNFGLTQSVIKDGLIKKTKRYHSVVQNNEMRKKRLAIVIKVLENDKVQVVPVTSRNPGIDKSTFQLSQQSLDPLVFYGTSGKSSWGLCNMIQTVDITRISPPLTKKFTKKSKTDLSEPSVIYIRDQSYKVRLNSIDKMKLHASLLSTSSPDNYLELLDIKRNFSSTKEQLAECLAQIEQLKAYQTICEAYGLTLDDLNDLPSK